MNLLYKNIIQHLTEHKATKQKAQTKRTKTWFENPRKQTKSDKAWFAKLLCRTHCLDNAFRISDNVPDKVSDNVLDNVSDNASDKADKASQEKITLLIFWCEGPLGEVRWVLRGGRQCQTMHQTISRQCSRQCNTISSRFP